MNARTVTVFTVDHGEVTLPEPFWCRGEHPAEGYREDIEHQGEDVSLMVETPCHGVVQLLTAALFQRPFSTHGPTGPLVAVEAGEAELHEYDARHLAGPGRLPRHVRGRPAARPDHSPAAP
ncbi:hypothetical protein RKD26_004838 [Streptomyces calvus]|uniref:DUF6907 domain-containing protein n=1 Tax=Streptomyces calvus TaxID=67282 RepID=UPI0035189D4B